MIDEPHESYHRVGSSIWREFATDDTRLMATYLLTCDHRTTEGLFVLPMGYVTADLGWSVRRARSAFDAILEHGLVRYDVTPRVCLIVKALKWQPPANPKVVTSAMRKLAGLPDTTLVVDFYEQAERYCPRMLKALREAFPKRLGERFTADDEKPSEEPLSHAHAHALTHPQNSLTADAVVARAAAAIS